MTKLRVEKLQRKLNNVEREKIDISIGKVVMKINDLEHTNPVLFNDHYDDMLHGYLMEAFTKTKRWKKLEKSRGRHLTNVLYREETLREIEDDIRELIGDNKSVIWSVRQSRGYSGRCADRVKLSKEIYKLNNKVLQISWDQDDLKAVYFDAYNKLVKKLKENEDVK